MTDDCKKAFEGAACANSAKDGGTKKNSARIKSMDSVANIHSMNLLNMGRGKKDGARRDI